MFWFRSKETKLDPKEFDYELIKFSTSEGKGLVIRRTIDGVRMRSESLALSTGLYCMDMINKKNFFNHLSSNKFSPGSWVLLIPETDIKTGVESIGVWDKEQKHQVGYLPQNISKSIKNKIINKEIKQCVVMWEYIGGEYHTRESIRLLLISDGVRIKIQ